MDDNSNFHARQLPNEDSRRSVYQARIYKRPFTPSGSALKIDNKIQTHRTKDGRVIRILLLITPKSLISETYLTRKGEKKVSPKITRSIFAPSHKPTPSLCSTPRLTTTGGIIPEIIRQ
ncbi:hypothetical protein NPIL_527821 [Nephila pilipes]|uniref:Uncharacterized protein n=1 Tax=Nephila pilipes TaxID=299642 RepID=A0A8X6PBD9_NEPPI|nr:hypothetical protein NPIL_527821 [Nephila pilipes]